MTVAASRARVARKSHESRRGAGGGNEQSQVASPYRGACDCDSTRKTALQGWIWSSKEGGRKAFQGCHGLPQARSFGLEPITPAMMPTANVVDRARHGRPGATEQPITTRYGAL